MNTTISISFNKKYTPDYDIAVGYATQFTSFVAASDVSSDNVVVIESVEIINKYDVLKKLLKVLENSKTTIINVEKRNFSPRVFLHESKTVIKCGIRCNDEENKTAYCNSTEEECWGCRFLTEPVLNFTAQPYYKYSKYWYSYGYFRTTDKWVINKKELQQALDNIIENKLIYLCPHFNDNLIKKTLESLPDMIDVSDDKKWGKIYSDQIGSDPYLQDAVNIHHRDEVYGFWKPGILPPESKTAYSPTTSKPESAQTHPDRYVPNVHYRDIGGISDVAKIIREVVVLPIKLPALFQHLGIVRNKGILLCGEQGNDKEMLACAVANDICAHFISVKGPEILVNWQEQPEQKFKTIIQEASELQPTVIFLDEFDCIAQLKSGYSNNNLEKRIINQLMTFMDELTDNSNITVIAAAVKPDTWDDGLFRQGRLDYQILIKPPTLDGCLQVLLIETREMPLADDVDFEYVAEKLLGLSRTDIKAVVKEAAISALRRSIDVDNAISDGKQPTDFSIVVVSQYDFIKAISNRKSRKQNL